MAKTKTAPPTDPIDPAVLVSALSTKIRGIRERDAELLQEQLNQEKAGVRPEAPQAEPDEDALARQFLNGYAPAKLVGSDDQRLHRVMLERRAIRLALGVLEEKQTVARLQAIAEATRSCQSSWLEL